MFLAASDWVSNFGRFGVIASSLVCLVVGLRYLAAALAWRDKKSALLGVWILVVAELGCLFPDVLPLIMVGLGGGGIVVATVAARLGLLAEKVTPTADEEGVRRVGVIENMKVHDTMKPR